MRYKLHNGILLGFALAQTTFGPFCALNRAHPETFALFILEAI
jgi:hypothetical protein